jgi:hypothetical protein
MIFRAFPWKFADYFLNLKLLLDLTGQPHYKKG